MATLLIIDDSPSHRSQARRLVEAEGVFDAIQEAEDGLRGLRLLLQDRPDVVLCDLEMPGLDGEKLLQARAARPELAHVPFVFLTASGDPIRRSRLLLAGACDAIVKPYHAHDLVARLRLHLRLKQLQDELRDKNAVLERLSSIDSLTGLRTRRVGVNVLALELERTRRYGGELALLLADLDHFKQVNDRHGHPAGDAVLRGVSEILLAGIRPTDVAARYGGEEILVVLPHTDHAGARALAERWRVAVECARFATPAGEAVPVTLSVGVAIRDRGEIGPDELIAAADEALYSAKRAGRNRIEG